MHAPKPLLYYLGIYAALSVSVCDKSEPVFGSNEPTPLADLAASGAFQFEPAATSAACTAGGDAARPLILAAGYGQTIVASEPDYPDLPDMNWERLDGIVWTPWGTLLTAEEVSTRLDPAGTLYITEDPGGLTATGKTIGDDIWVATPDRGSSGVAASVVRFATLTDCDAEPTGIYFGKLGATTLYVNIQHRGGDGLDKSLAISEAK